MKWWRKQNLPVRILIGALIGIALGVAFGPKVAVLKPIGDIFIRLLQMIIVPLTFLSIVSGIAGLENPKMLRAIGGRIFIYYAMTAVLATSIGVVIAFIINPGKGVEGLLANGQNFKEEKFSFVDNIVQWFPSNVIQAASETSMLQIIIFAIFVGIALILLGDQAKGTRKLVHEGSKIMIKIAEIVIGFAPYGIMALIAHVVGTFGADMLTAVVSYVVADYLSLLLILFIMYPIVLKVFGKISPIHFYKQVSPAMLVAASTTSSSATLPVTMEVAQKRLRIPESVAGFTIPLGATVNMNGLSAALGVLAVFALNVYGIPITFGLIMQTVFLGIVLAAGCAGVKGADVITATILLSTLGLPLTIIPIIAAVSPLVDMGHTVVNITGDLVGAQVVNENITSSEEKNLEKGEQIC
ncbi:MULTISPECIES: dicarboxylate/amino acid:cation symporter [Bacillus cereus group]|uniref:dicarboxylate/amino acid:cation symporter n=1 Tax=Bacillus cereus group TaxID=86661 RepID=UPI000B452B53|nr:MULTISPECIES: dicarboxylate/amino acid:cation symporter [Bacillus cereus group]OTX29000.1 dicarboxylate/amino acid:cation symporter [Bacillus thuringiensis serovar malayensis]OUB02862.1 dicarboxylate/amino acid:cation symporter [Bacillus thuringiensis serovar shandongiensis]MBJ8101732.1 dicarboxylate/amino acid:cation symporter [Bacillus cereus group sp. N11]MBX0354373.1 dicarboxylate/amino acid:cation symporter [Bacillus toyonensis]MDM5257397.1 dicarboxylate/amino acid:cation symporter [Ba